MEIFCFCFVQVKEFPSAMDIYKYPFYIIYYYGEFPMKSIRIPTKMSKELAYLLGVLCGDGYIQYSKRRGKYKTKHKIKQVIIRSRGTYKIGLEAKDNDFVGYFAFCLSKITGREPGFYVVKRKTISGKPLRYTSAYLYSKKLIEYLLSFGDFGTYVWRVPQCMLESDNGIKFKFLQGLYDSEGYVQWNKRIRWVKLGSVNPNGLEDIKSMLDELGFKGVFIYRNLLIIGKKENLVRFRDNISFNISRKKDRLVKAINSYTKR